MRLCCAWRHEIDDATAQITLRVQSTQTRAPCPLCATPARRIHSDYGRTLADLPWAQYRVSSSCASASGFATIAPVRVVSSLNACPPWPPPGRAHAAARSAPRGPGVALGGKAGVHLGHQWVLVVSRNTLLRLLRRQPARRSPRPPSLADAFALRKRQTYGTILVDLERRQPVALLPDRTAETVAQWLRAHPGSR